MIHLKKLTLTLVALFALSMGAWADKVTVLKADPVTVANGEEAELKITMDYTTAKTLVGLIFSLYLPDGILLKGFDTKEAQDAAKASELKRAFDINVETGLWGVEEGASGWFSVKPKTDGGFLITFIDQDDKTAFVNTHAPVITINVHAVADVSNVNGTINGITLTDNENNSVEQGNIAEVLIPFNATAQEPDPNAVAISWDNATKTATIASMPAGDVELQVEYYPGMLVKPTNLVGGTMEIEGLTDTTLPEGFEKDDDGNIYVAKDTKFTVKAVPDEGFHLVSWSDDATITDLEREITMGDDDFELTATFSDKYIVTLNAEGLSDEEAAAWKGATGDNDPAAFPLENVSAGSEVKVTYTGSRKVIGVKAEKKAAAAAILAAALKDGATVTITYVWLDTNVTTFTYTNNGGTYTGNTTGVDAEYFANGMSMDGTTLKFTASNPDISDANVSIEFDTDTNEYAVSKGSLFTSFTISVNGTDLTSQLTKVK